VAVMAYRREAGSARPWTCGMSALLIDSRLMEKKAVRATLVHGCAAMANGTRGATHRGESSLGELERRLWISNYSSEEGGMPWR
jgi:hypothetical protein